ncbi:MAG: hypothetical protein SFU53_00330 [Terrimicrobiaceae bacterium]|nr:hypothetical protein [Terrimicrobiaceae bacterium]
MRANIRHVAAIPVVLIGLLSCSRPLVPTAKEALEAKQSDPQPQTTTNPDWQRDVERILTSQNVATAPALFAAMPKLPVQAIRQYLPRALDLCEDEEFRHAERIYFNTGMPRFVAESIFDDALNRPDDIKLPLLAKTAMSPNHPMAAQARELLEVYLELAPGRAPEVPWDLAVKKYLEENQ